MQFFEILAPAFWQVPVVFNSPHSGALLPNELLSASKLSAIQLRQSQDSHVDELFQDCQNLGAPLLRALVSRAYIDLNREPYELDARMISEKLPGHMNPGSPRVAAGLGTIPKTVAEGLDIYPGKISLREALSRIDQVYRPYHRTLTAMLNQCYNATGFSLLIDCHSMPSSAVRSFNGQTVDIVLGNRFGAACALEISIAIESFLKDSGFKVQLNKPYAGGFITETHGNPRHNRHALQIEINRAVYMNEATQVKNTNFDHTRAKLKFVIEQILAFIQQEQIQQQAAE